MLNVFAVLPRWESAELLLTSSPLLANKRPRLCCTAPVVPQLLFSTGLGGERDDGVGDAASATRRWLSGSEEHATSAAVPKRRQVPAAAIFGQEVGPAALVPLVGASFFNLLQWRIFSDCGVAVSATASPSGFVPGRGSGGCACCLAGQRSSAATSDSIAFLRVTVGCCVQNCRTLL